MTQTTMNVLIGFGLVLVALMGLIVVAIAMNASLGVAVIFFCVLSGLGSMMLSTVFTAIDNQRKVDAARAKREQDTEQER